jgi:decaprenylphospho-beta-D-erythro-pentofuranosid-2-ulose 2-reductase
MKRVLILGASSEVALALSDIFASQSIDLILAARNVERLSAVKSDLSIRYGAQITLSEFDAADPNSHTDFYKNLNPKPDTVICVFGYLGDHGAAINDWEECSRILMTNFVGAVSILNILASDFEKMKTGIIVGISSVAGERGRQSNYLYGSAKAGFTAYLSGLRNRLFKHNVHVLTVKPGFMKTRMLAGMSTPKVLTAQPQQAALQIIKAIKKKKDVVYVFSIWKWVMLIIRNIPEFIFKRLKL